MHRSQKNQALKGLCLALVLCCQNSWGQVRPEVYVDRPFAQVFSHRYDWKEVGKLEKSLSDRDGQILSLGAQGLYQAHGASLLQRGGFLPYQRYRTMAHRPVQGLALHQGAYVFLDRTHLFSQDFGGRLLLPHSLPKAKYLAAGEPFEFLISDGKQIQYLVEKQGLQPMELPRDSVLDLRYLPLLKTYLILGKEGLYAWKKNGLEIQKILNSTPLQAFDVDPKGRVYLGGPKGYRVYDLGNKQWQGEWQEKLPCPDIHAIHWSADKLWFGSSKGAFSWSLKQGFEYYQGERWLPGDEVKHISSGKDGSVWISTNKGLAHLQFQKMTLEEKARFFQTQVRERHMRNGFNASLVGMQKGQVNTGYLSDSDNDGLWTSMYLGAEIFRYAVTRAPDALENCRSSMDAMERLYALSGVPGFPARSFERKGYRSQLADPERWRASAEQEWDAKGTTSSDEAIGHVFAFGAMAELVDDPDLKKRAITLLDTLMSHILDHDWYLIDADGKPTLWGKWNPSYVNGFPTNIGDRKLNSSNIIAMLQTAYAFTKKEKYKSQAKELMQKHGYFENLMRPFKQIGIAQDDADAKAKLLSDAWNHSDDEMYFLGYWGLYRYAFHDSLKASYKKAILDHWAMERPEKEGAWNIFTALTGEPKVDIDAAAWYLREHPLDLIDWNIENSHRKDLEWLAPNFRTQRIKTVLSPKERPIQRHNANMFNLDSKGGNGLSEHSAGDIWLLPYWMGRYLKIITPGVGK